MDDPSNICSLLPSNTPLIVSFIEDEDIPCLISPPEECRYVVKECSQLLADSAKGVSFKGCILESGQELSVPDFISAGDTVIVDVISWKYVSRS